MNYEILSGRKTLRKTQGVLRTGAALRMTEGEKAGMTEGEKAGTASGPHQMRRVRKKEKTLDPLLDWILYLTGSPIRSGTSVGDKRRG